MKHKKVKIPITTFLVCTMATLSISCHRQKTLSPQRILVTVKQPRPLEWPQDKRVAFGWHAVGIAPGDTLWLEPKQKLVGQHHWLRLTVAQEIWDENRVHAFIPKKNIPLGTFDIKYSSVLVPYEIEIPGEYISMVNKHGINLVLESKTPIWFYSDTAHAKGTLGLVPHILSANETTGNVNDFLACFQSLNSIQAFGWREGTV